MYNPPALGYVHTTRPLTGSVNEASVFVNLVSKPTSQIMLTDRGRVPHSCQLKARTEVVDVPFSSVYFELGSSSSFVRDDIAVCDSGATTGTTAICGLDHLARGASLICNVDFAS